MFSVGTGTINFKALEQNHNNINNLKSLKGVRWNNDMGYRDIQN